MYGFLLFLHVVVSVLLIVVVLMQSSRGGGLSGTFGGGLSTAIFGGQGAGGFLSKVTAGLASAFMILAILISLMNVPKESSDSIVRKKAEERVMSPADELPIPASPSVPVDLPSGE